MKYSKSIHLKFAANNDAKQFVGILFGKAIFYLVSVQNAFDQKHVWRKNKWRRTMINGHHHFSIGIFSHFDFDSMQNGN